ncbi:MAG: DUF5658 family protein [Bacillota bacterium]
MKKQISLTKSQDRILGFLLSSIAIFNSVDYLLTVMALKNGFRELNPVMNAIVFTPYFPLVKLVIVPFLLYIIWRMRSRTGRRIMLYAWATFSVYLFLMVYFRLHVVVVF